MGLVCGGVDGHRPSMWCLLVVASSPLQGYLAWGSAGEKKGHAWIAALAGGSPRSGAGPGVGVAALEHAGEEVAC